MNIWMIAFLLLPLTAIAYIGWHVWCLLPLSWIWKSVAIALLAGSFLLMFAGIWRSTDRMPMPLAVAVYEVGTSSIFVLLYLFMLFLVLDLGRLFRLVPRTVLYQNWWTTGAVALFMLGLFLYGYLHYQHKYRQELTLKTQKHIGKPVRLVMVSDLHIGYHNRRSELHRWVDMINAERPDLVLIAGDIIDGSMRPLREQRMHEEFRRLQAPVYACLGNHEYYSGEPQAQQFYHEAGIRLLSDNCALVDSALLIIGRDDRTNRRRKSVADVVSTSLKLNNASALNHSALPYVILLDHQPYELEQSEQAGVDFQLSGHTHRGQVWPISWITDALYECSWGSLQRGNTRYYVSSGLGIWGGKYRIGTQSEYVVATIRKQ